MAEGPRLIVGCPVRKREWILPRWKEALEVAADRAGVSIGYCFVVGTDDIASLDIFDSPLIRVVKEENREDRRRWNPERYAHMIEIRNLLLGEVRGLSPDLFLSLDSDILLHPDSLTNMLETIEGGAWAVGGKAFMTTSSESFPSYGLWTDKRSKRAFVRKPCSAVIPVDVIMAVKLMTPEAYGVDYAFHPWGEDAGWSIEVTNRGGSFLWDGRVPNKHVMQPELLDLVDKRCGY